MPGRLGYFFTRAAAFAVDCSLDTFPSYSSGDPLPVRLWTAGQSLPPAVKAMRNLLLDCYEFAGRSGSGTTVCTAGLIHGACEEIIK